MQMNAALYYGMEPMLNFYLKFRKRKGISPIRMTPPTVIDIILIKSFFIALSKKAPP